MLGTLGYNSYFSTKVAGLGKYMSSVLASILYKMDKFNVTVDNLRAVANGGGAGHIADAPMYASNHIFLDGSTQSVDYPIPHTLGSEIAISWETDTWSDRDNMLVEQGGTTVKYTAGAYPVFSTSIVNSYSAEYSVEAGKTYSIYMGFTTNTFTSVSTRDVYNATAAETYPVNFIKGTYDFTGLTEIEYEFNATSDGLIRIYSMDTGTVASGEILEISQLNFKQITNPNSFLTYFDTATKSHVTIDNSIVPSTIHTQEDSHSNIFTTTKEVLSTDLTYIDANPESVARLVDGETVAGLSFDLTDIEAFYPANEGEASGAYVQDIVQPLGSIETASGSNHVTAGIGNTITGGTGVVTVHNEIATGDTSKPRAIWYFSQLELTDVFSITFTLTITSGACKIASIMGIAEGSTYQVGVHSFSYIGTLVDWGGNSSAIVFFDGNTETTFDATVSHEVKQATTSEIINYASTCRANLDLTNYGASNLLYKQDATGRFTGMADAGTIVGANDGRNIDIQMTTPYNHLVIKDIDKIEGTLDSCTITYVDTTTEIVP